MSHDATRTWAGLLSATLVGTALAAVTVTAGPAAPADAAAGTDSGSPVLHDRLVSDVPAAFTPRVDNGRVLTIAQVGDTMVAGGSFTQVSPSSGGTGLPRQNVFSFSATTGAIHPGFNPTVNGVVNAVAPGPLAGTVYVAGSFTTINGVATRVALLDARTGATVASFGQVAVNGAISDLAKIGNRLFLSGNFTKVSGVPHQGLATVNATTGGPDAFLGVDVAGHHNFGINGTAESSVGVAALAVSPDGRRLAAIGNFRTADGLPRDQAVLVDISGAAAVVAADWRTRRYEPSCFASAFDSYVRDVDFAPDGSYFTVVSTGGPNPGTLCDTVARWQTAATGDDVQPVWVDDTGGDTLFSVAATGAAVYVGGHQRWMNNAGGRDAPNAGAVPRPGLAAVDAVSGVPVAWNPGRSPRGVGAFALTPTASGLWVGSDTPYVGGGLDGTSTVRYLRPRLAFFPLAGGTRLGEGSSGALPANVYRGGSASASNVLHRVNAGGAAVAATDTGPDWSADQSATSPYRNSGSNPAGYSPVAAVDATVPGSTPRALFDSERWDPSGGTELEWHFPVQAAQHVQVRLYFANRCSCTGSAGQRAFDVSVEGAKVLSRFDIVAAAGNQTGTMRSVDVPSSDGSVDISLGHLVENPLINAIEIVKVGASASPATSSDALVAHPFDGAAAPGPAAPAPDGGIAWSTVRGATVIDGQLFYLVNDGTLHRRTFDGRRYGADVVVNPYDDPRWATVSTGSGQTYRGAAPGLFGESVNGLAYLDGQLYTTGGGTLSARGFSPDSGVVSGVRRTVADIAGIGGVFFSGGQLWYSSTVTGTLSRVAWVAGAPSGAATVVSGPGVDGIDWRSRTLFRGTRPVANAAPTAAFTPACSGSTCSFDGGSSSDPTADPLTYAWGFGDGSTGTGVTAQHRYAAPGPYDVTLTVTDDAGSSSTSARRIVVAPPMAFVGATQALAEAAAVAVDVPSDVRPGDALLLFATVNTGTADTVGSPPGDGWSTESTQVSGTMQTVLFSKVAGAGDAGSRVTLALRSAAKVDVELAAYRGTSPTDPTRSVQTRANGAVSAHPAAPAVAAAGDWVVTHWADRSSGTTGWTPPTGVVRRAEQYGVGAARVTGLVTDSGGAMEADGTYQAGAATTNATSGRGTSVTVVLAGA